MSLPLPTDMVTVLFADAAGQDQGATNAGTAIIIHPEFEHDPDLLTGVLAHEVAHYYWRGNKDWLDEGIAEIIQAYQQRETNGSEMTLSHPRAGRRRASGNWRPSTWIRATGAITPWARPCSWASGGNWGRRNSEKTRKSST